MTSSAFWAYGSLLQMGDGATPEVFTTIAEIIEVKPPNSSRDAIQVSSHGSSDGYHEYLPGMRDGGEIPVTANWLPTNATQDQTTGVLESFNDDSIHNWKWIAPDTLVTCSFAGFLTAFEPDTPLTEQGKLSFTIKVTGKPTYS
jgi:predicted secreted protein